MDYEPTERTELVFVVLTSVLSLLGVSLLLGDESKPVVKAEVVAGYGSKVDELALKLAEIRKRKKELDDEEAKVRLELEGLMRKWHEWLRSLGLDVHGPVVPPVPESVFAKALTDAWNSERESQKKEKAKVLSAIYRLAAKEAQNPEWDTCAELAELISMAIEKAEGLGSDSLVGVRSVVRQELSRTAPNLETKLTADLRRSVERVYREAADVLDRLSAS